VTTLEIRRREAHIAYNRFGLGAKRGRFDSIVANPRAAVLAELDRPGNRFLFGENLPNHVDACRASANAQISRSIFNSEIHARLNKHMEPEIGFVERLVLFWSNHFNIYAGSGGPARSAVGEMERNRIRLNVLGNFRTLLRSVVTHPATIYYLQNGLSIGPNSSFGRQSNRGLNENLARELLELYTVGVSAPFTQNDVENSAKILTGFSLVTPWHGENFWQGGTPHNIGQFIFRENWQEPGTQVVMGRGYASSGITKALHLLNNLSIHPSTAQHIGFKLVKHFISDNPTPAMVGPVARAFLSSGGDLKTTYRALLNLPSAWAMPLSKLKSPYELFVSQARAAGRNWSPARVNTLRSGLVTLGNAPFDWMAPDGFPDDSAHWSSSDAIVSRISTTQVLVRRLLAERSESSTALQIAEGILGVNLSPATRAELQQTPNLVQALCKLFTSPEMMMR